MKNIKNQSREGVPFDRYQEEQVKAIIESVSYLITEEIISLFRMVAEIFSDLIIAFSNTLTMAI